MRAEADMRHRPYCLRRRVRRRPTPRQRGLPCSPHEQARGWSAAWRCLWSAAGRRRAPSCAGRVAARRSMAAISVPGAVLPGCDGPPVGPLIRRTCAPLHRRRVQPLKAAGRDAGGRLGQGLPGAGLRSLRAGAAHRRRVAPEPARSGRRRISDAVPPGCSTSGSPLEAPLMSRPVSIGTGYTPNYGILSVFMGRAAEFLINSELILHLERRIIPPWMGPGSRRAIC